ncbi:signal peptide peptidase SppA [Rhodocista pekingensis]|uniref:Signal peptide peptidase SppA n=1 Tax=Rhodocista pekingensis TaxID=201185 RepID=A0ABW2KWJ9_9PROT
MMKVIVRIFAVIGLLAVLLVGGAVAIGMMLSPGRPTLPDSVVLELDLEKPLSEQAPGNPFAALSSDQKATLHDVVATLDRAARDPRVKGLIAHAGTAEGGVATLQELRDAVERFRAAGKFALVHAETFGEFSPGMQSYYLATAFDEIWLQPVGTLGITGVLSERPLLRGTLEKLKIEPQIDKRYEYKTAAEQFMEREPTPANKEMTESLIGDLYEQMVAGIAADRKLPIDAVNAAVDRAPLLDKEALELKLVDRLGYYDELVDAAKERTRSDKGTAKTVALTDYRDAAEETDAQAPVVALVVGEGGITRGESDSNPVTGSEGFGATDVAKAINAAAADSSVKAILFRVNSPGGSAVGSEVVRRAVKRAREQGKPVIVSMGDLAASGGYWVSMDADRIVAQPGTFTGSIGVLGGKMVTSGLTDMLGVSYGMTSRGKNATMWTTQQPYTPAELDRRAALLDDIYVQFTAGVSAGRNLPLEKVQEVAKGRVWTGRQAKEIGLVDALGGYATALAQTREVMGLSADAPVRVALFPKPKSQFELIMSLFDGGARVQLGQWVLADALAEYRPLLTQVEPLLRATRTEEQTVLMPPVGIAGH